MPQHGGTEVFSGVMAQDNASLHILGMTKELWRKAGFA